jgi:hypothetical protein
MVPHCGVHRVRRRTEKPWGLHSSEGCGGEWYTYLLIGFAHQQTVTSRASPPHGFEAVAAVQALRLCVTSGSKQRGRARMLWPSAAHSRCIASLRFLDLDHDVVTLARGCVTHSLPVLHPPPSTHTPHTHTHTLTHQRNSSTHKTRAMSYVVVTSAHYAELVFVLARSSRPQAHCSLQRHWARILRWSLFPLATHEP